MPPHPPGEQSSSLNSVATEPKTTVMNKTDTPFTPTGLAKNHGDAPGLFTKTSHPPSAPSNGHTAVVLSPFFHPTAGPPPSATLSAATVRMMKGSLTFSPASASFSEQDQGTLAKSASATGTLTNYPHTTSTPGLTGQIVKRDTPTPDTSSSSSAPPAAANSPYPNTATPLAEVTSANK